MNSKTLEQLALAQYYIVTCLVNGDEETKRLIQQALYAHSMLVEMAFNMESKNEDIDAAAQQRELARLEAESKRAEQLQRLNSHAEKSTRMVVK